MEALRNAANRHSSGRAPGRAPLLTASAVILVVVIGLAAWLGRDDSRSLDTDRAADQTADDVDSLVGTTWTLRAGGGPAGDIVLVEGHPITLTFEADDFGGTAACNGYGSRYTIDGDRIDIEGISATEMGCEPAVQAAEQAYFAALADVEEIALVGDELTLGGPSTELVFTRQQPAPTEDLVDTLWLLDTLIRGDAASTVLGEPATLFIGSDGTFSGGSGCRSFSGRYQTFGAEVQFTEFGAGPEECPTGLRDQDNQVFSVLGDGFTAEIDGRRLTVMSSGGEGLGYRAITSDELAEIAPRPVASDAELLEGVEWTLVAGYGDADNQDQVTIDPGIVDTARRPTLTFGDGGLQGYSGCNGFSGAAEVGNGSLTVTDIESETRACDPPINELENDYLNALMLMTGFGLDDGGQRLVMGGGDIELHFERTGG